MLSTDLTEFIRTVPIALSLTDRNGTERKDQTGLRYQNRQQNYRNIWTGLYIQRKGKVGYGRAGQGGVSQDRSKVGVGWGGGRVGVGLGGKVGLSGVVRGGVEWDRGWVRG